jgi:thiamine monophosphate kinase
MYRKSATITVAALNAAAEEIYSITDAKARVGDVVVVNEPAGGGEAGWHILGAWVDSVGVIKVKASNLSGSQLTGGSVIVRYAVIR